MINYGMEYKIIEFFPQIGQIVIKCEDIENPIHIDLPIDNGKYPEGEDLDYYIRGFIPAWITQRNKKIKNGIENSDYIQSLVEKPIDKNFDVKDFFIKRHALLVQSDWTQLPDSPLSENQKKRWAKYRQELRDITNKPITEKTEWPKKPEILSTIYFNYKGEENE